LVGQRFLFRNTLTDSKFNTKGTLSIEHNNFGIGDLAIGTQRLLVLNTVDKEDVLIMALPL
jgi:hypothetical protein